MTFWAKVFGMFLMLCAVVVITDYFFRLPETIEQTCKEPPMIYLVIAFGIAFLIVVCEGKYRS